PTPPDDAACAALLEAAWDAREPPLAERARDFAARYPRSPLSPRKTLLAAPGLEAAARAAEELVLRWLADGLRDIALVAEDRLMARRLRALLERHGILTQDETGWAFATASASHLPEAWLRLLTADAWFRDLLDLLKSPYVFADAGELRERAVHELDAAFRRHGAPDGLAGHLELARREGLHAALPLLRRIDAAIRAFGRGRQTLGEWTLRLLAALRALAAEEALCADPVGRQLWSLLETLAREGAAHRTRYALADWRRWLFHYLEESTFLDGTVSSPVRLTHLAAAHTRDWQGVIVLGAGAAHLPGVPSAALFNDATRLQLGLPAAAERELELRAALGDVLARVPRVALIWQSERDGDPAPLSPWLVHLDAFQRAAWDEAWLTPAPPRPLAGRLAGTGQAEPFPAPGAPAVPARISVSAWQSLVACPYQFFARHVLRLNERDEVPEEMDKADYGSLVHRILARFHESRPVLGDATPEELALVLSELSRAVFAPAEAASYLGLAWRLRWERHIAAYVDWALQREREGYRFGTAEAPLAREVTWGEAGVTQLHGRADRLDEHAGGPALLDYKTQSRQALKRKLDSGGEDVQLPAYAWLAGAVEAGFVTVDADKVETLAWPEGLAEAAEAESARLRATLADLAAGAPLPAQGAPETCAWCEMRGLCRIEHRDSPQA
ncbi:MAG: Inactivated superfamily I helicase, partial [bacterium]